MNVWRNPSLLDEKPRPKSASTVYFHTDPPFNAEWSELGKSNRTSILRSIDRCRSATETPCTTSWVQPHEKLCKIRDYYRFKSNGDRTSRGGKSDTSVHSFLTGSRYTSSHWLDLNSKDEGIFTSKANLCNTFQLPKSKPQRKRMKSAPPTINKEFTHKEVNTEDSFLTINRWHSATWQHPMPKMYMPPEERYDAYASVPVRTKQRPQFYPEPSARRRSGRKASQTGLKREDL